MAHAGTSCIPSTWQSLCILPTSLVYRKNTRGQATVHGREAEAGSTAQFTQLSSCSEGSGPPSSDFLPLLAKMLRPGSFQEPLEPGGVPGDLPHPAIPGVLGRPRPKALYGGSTGLLGWAGRGGEFMCLGNRIKLRSLPRSPLSRALIVNL